MWCSRAGLLHQTIRQSRFELQIDCLLCSRIWTLNVIAYYTLSASSFDLNDIPGDLESSLKYVEITVLIIGRLAVYLDYQGKKLGQILLIDALKRIIEVSALVGNHAVVVDPINESAKKFYSKFGFIQLKDSKRMFIALKTVTALFEKE